MKNVDTQKSKTGLALSVFVKIVLSAVVAAVVVFGGSLLGLLLASEDIHLAVTYVVGYLPFALLLPLIWVKNKKKYGKTALIIVVLCLVLLGANFAVLKYDDSLKVDTSCCVEDQNYLPFFENSKIVKAESETLKLTDNFPLIDGAAELLPLYSAFINAVYPETDTPYGDYLYDNGQEAYEYLASGESDILIDLYYSEERKAYAENIGADFEYTDIASDAFVFIVHKDNPVDSLTVEQLKGIYSGCITNWAELGGKNKQIKAYQNEEDSFSQNMMELFMGETALMDAPSEMGYDYLYAWEEQLSEYRNKAGSIAYTFRHCVVNNPDVKMLSVEGVAPAEENIQNGSYPFAFPVVAVTCDSNTNENIDKLLNWILSDEGRYIVEQTGYAGVLSE